MQGVTSKLNRRLTAHNRRFRAVAIVQNNSNRPEPLVTGGQQLVEFWSDPQALYDRFMGDCCSKT